MFGPKCSSRSCFAVIAAGLLSVGMVRLVCAEGHARRNAISYASASRVGMPAPNWVPRSRDGMDMVGKPAPAWGDLDWLNSPPLRLKDLRGKVVLIRFWTNTCPFCAATAPALRQIDHDFARRGVVVIGMYHPKPPGANRSVQEVEQAIHGWGWRFPVGLDIQWKALQSYWLNGPHRDATSASFLIDQRGIIRWVHPGPEFHPGGPADHQQCRDDYRDLRQAVEALLAEGGQNRGGRQL